MNQVRLYNGKNYQYLDFIDAFSPYFRKLNGLQKYHHFFFSKKNLRIVRVQQFANSPVEEFVLLKSEQDEVLKGIRNIKFTSLKPLPIELSRQEYLFNNIRPFVDAKYQDLVCPKPKK